MTWYQLVYLTCDHNTCDHSYLSRIHGEGMRSTRTRASELGWKVHENRDYCPDHADTGVARVRVARMLPAEKPEVEHTTPRKRRASASTGAGDG